MAFAAQDQRGASISQEERDLVARMPERMQSLRAKLGERIVGQEKTIEQLLVCFLSGGHGLIIGVPGLAKTLMIRSLSELFALDFARIQFTPDLMPSDITGTTLLVQNETSGQREFRFRKGPVFTNLLLADEINRTPPKTQSALLEAMEEDQVTVGGTHYPVGHPFFVLATQNPIEQEGTYPLPITQLDRFQFQINIDYPDEATEFDVVAATTAHDETSFSPILSHDEVLELLTLPKKLPIPDALLQRATRLVRSTRLDEGDACDATREWISWGAGPRAVQAILNTARARAVMSGRLNVTDEDYEAVVLPALRHRVLLNYHAEAENVTPDDVLTLIRHQINDAPAAPVRAQSKKTNRLIAWLNAWGDPAPRFKRVDS